jgi:predicted ABC-type ATPase
MEKDKTLFIIAGANGSGKTTFALNFSALKDLYFINADEIAKEFDSNDMYKHKIKAGKEFFKRLHVKLQENNSFVIETTLSGKYLVNVIKEAKSEGFQVVLIYLYLENSRENILRVKNRVLAGGHNIPKEDIIRRYNRSKNLFLHLYRELVDEWSLFYNGDDKFELIANSDEILDEDLYDEFINEER